MALTGQNFTMWEGDSLDVVIATVDADGGPYNLTGAAITWGMSINSVTAPVISKSTGDGSITINSPAGSGVFTVALNAGDTTGIPGYYYHEARVTDVDGKPRVIATGFITLNASNI